VTRARVARADVDRYRDRLRRDGAAIEFVGPAGRGKTTHLLALRETLERATYLEIPPNGSAPSWPSAPVLLVDEFQFLAPTDRNALPHSVEGLAVGAHESVRDDLESAGWDVESVEVATRSRSRLGDLVRARIEWARREEGPVPELTPEASSWLRERYGTDLRAVEKHLYEVFQALEKPTSVGVEMLEAVERTPRPSTEIRTVGDC